jgi:ATP synthase protein I
MSNNLTKKIEKKIKDSEPKNIKNKSSYSLGLKISMDLVSSIIAGTLIGLGVDKFFSTKPIFFLIFLLLGIITGFYSLYKSVKKLN